VTADQAWEIAKVVFRTEGGEAIEEHRSEGYMLTSAGFTLFTAGTVMGAWVESKGPSQTEVTVLTKRRIATNIVTVLTETTFHNRFQQGVKIIQSGNPLPAVLPNME